MDLGSFSVSLAVKDLQASRDFYEKLGFESAGGDVEQGWLILRNRAHVIGLFEGMFEQNILTFNPGWNQAGEERRELHGHSRDPAAAQGPGHHGPASEVDENGTGPASLMLTDPDGNTILLDQHR